MLFVVTADRKYLCCKIYIDKCNNLYVDFKKAFKKIVIYKKARQ